MQASAVRISLRDAQLYTRDFQCTLPSPTAHTEEIARAAILLMQQKYSWNLPLRSASVCAFHLISETEPLQIALPWERQNDEKSVRLEDTLDALQEKYGVHSIQSASSLNLSRDRGNGALLHADRGWNPGFSLRGGQR